MFADSPRSRGFHVLGLVLSATVVAPLVLPAPQLRAQEAEVTDSAAATSAADSAQEEVGQQSPLEEADSLLTFAVMLNDSVIAMATRLPGTVGEDRALLTQRIARIQEEFDLLRPRFQALLPELDSTRADVGLFLERVALEVERRARELHDLIDGVLADVVAADNARDTVSVEGLVEFDELRLSRSEALDQTLTEFLVANQHVGEVGRDTLPGWEYFDPIIQRRAEDLAARIEFRKERVRLLEGDIARLADAAPADLRLRLDSETRGVERNLKSLGVMADLMEARGLPTGRYRELLVLSGGGLTTEVLNPSILGSLARRGWRNLSTWVMGNIGTWGLRLGVFFLILILFSLLGRVTKRVVGRALGKGGVSVSVLLRDTLIAWAGRLVFLLGLLIALDQIGLNLAPVLAGMGVAGFVIGFALQDTLANFAAGIMILMYRPFDVKDVVEAGGVFGKVASMSLVSTTINTFDNQRLVVPNNLIWGQVIRNVTGQRIRRVDLTFGIGYSDDIPKAEGILARLVEEHPMVLSDPEPIIKLNSLGESSVDFVVRPWCLTDDYWDVHWDLTRGVKMAFDAEGISIPFPQRDVHLYSTEKSE